jgi:hypothetical protein
VQAILAIQPPKGVKQLRHFLGMVQYYRDLWRRRSDMLAPLTALVGECGQTKISKAKGTKKVPVGCFKRSLIYKCCSNQLMSTSTKQGKKVGVFSCQNPRENCRDWGGMGGMTFYGAGLWQCLHLHLFSGGRLWGGLHFPLWDRQCP